MDMKRNYILLIALSVFVLSSCTKGDKVIAEGETSGIALTVICKEASTKATRPGEDAYNENRLRSIDYFFYPEGGTGSNAVIHKRVGVDVINQHTMSVNLDEATLNNVLFPGYNQTCQVAVIANYPTEITGNTDLETLKGLTLSTDFKGSPVQPSFVMFGTATVQLISRKQTTVAAPTVELRRVASKVTLSAHVSQSVEITNKIIVGGIEYDRIETWTPNMEGMKLYLVNGEKNAVVEGDPSKVATHELFKYSERAFTSETEQHTITRQVYNAGTSSWTTVTSTEEFIKSYPYYTYPETWVNNDPNEPYLKLVLPWTRQAGSDEHGSWGSVQKQFYYHVVLPNNATGFVSNNWYKIFLEVAILGSDTDEAQVDIEGNYYVVPWNSTVVEKQVDILSTRYLSVAFNSYTMPNTQTLKIPYVTSNKCEIADLNVKQYNFNTNQYVDKTATALADNWVTLDNNNNIVINHELNNDLTSSGFDASPYIFTFKIWHQDLHSYVEELTITQDPAMYIEQETTTTGRPVFVNSTSSTQSNYAHPTGTSSYYLGVIINRSAINDSGGNTNPRQYTVHVSVLSNPDWYLGDPRVATGTTLSNLPTRNTATGTTGLYRYKQTDDGMDDCIAPVFKVASSYGRTYALSYEQAVRRCASYQENGYPAGRWRLPTAAEIQFLVTLSDKGKIPALFSASVSGNEVSAYWAAGRKAFDGTNFTTIPTTATLSGQNTTQGSRYYTYNSRYYYVYTRCVYDVWYWGDDKVANPGQWAGYND